jgi:hypothetical protein
VRSALDVKEKATSATNSIITANNYGRLLDLGFDDLMRLFYQLDAPTMFDMHGEYSARLLAQRSLLDAIPVHMLLYTPFVLGTWQCKAFRPVTKERGRGYNTFTYSGHTVFRAPMDTLIAPSRFDARPAYHLVYSGYRRSIAGTIRMVDEIRKISNDAYLGMGTWGYAGWQRQRPIPFLLTGPISPYRDDIGVAKSGFDVRSQIPALKRKRL